MKFQELDVIKMVVALRSVPAVPLQAASQFEVNNFCNHREQWLKRQEQETKCHLGPNVSVPACAEVAVSSTLTECNVQEAVFPVAREVCL